MVRRLGLEQEKVGNLVHTPQAYIIKENYNLLSVMLQVYTSLGQHDSRFMHNNLGKYTILLVYTSCTGSQQARGSNCNDMNEDIQIRETNSRWISSERRPN